MITTSWRLRCHTARYLWHGLPDGPNLCALHKCRRISPTDVPACTHSTHTQLYKCCLPPPAAHVSCLLQAESLQYQQQFHDTQQQLSDLQERHQRQTLELEAQLREQAAAAQQDKLQQVAAVKEQLER